MTALQAAGAPADADFRARCKYFGVKAAVAVTTEAESVARHYERLMVAQGILASPDEYAGRFSLLVMTNATLFAATNFAAIVDGDLEFTLNSVFNSLIGT